MRPAPPFMDGGFSLPPLTKRLIVVFVGLSILDPVAERWLRLFSLKEWLLLEPWRVLPLEPWRLITYPWLAESPFGLLLGGLMLFFFAAPLEQSWGPRVFLRRLLVLVAAPALAVTLLSFAVRPLAGMVFGGLSALLYALVTAFAAQLRGRKIFLFPLPIALTGDLIIYLQAAFLGLGILFGGSIVPHLLSLFSFALSLFWFRLDSFREVRRSWLRLRRRRMEARLQKLRRQRPLRVVSSEDEDENDTHRYLN